MTTRHETLSQAAVEPTEPPIEESQYPNLTNQNDLDDAPNQQDWWDDADVSRLIDPEAFHRFLYSCDKLLENLDSDHDDDEAMPLMAGSDPKPSLDEQLKLRQSPPAKG